MKALVLSSGGLDSTVCVGYAVSLYGAKNVTTLSAYYGQRHDKELECAKKVAEYYGVDHYELDLSKIFEASNNPLLKKSTDAIPTGSYEEQQQKDKRVATYVPFRNGLLLASAASFAGSIYPDDNVKIMYGAHADDAAGEAYADCSPKFADAINKAITIGTYDSVSLEAPLVNMTKAQVVERGIQLNVPFGLTWSCYNGGEKQCGKCGTCIDRKKAFELNGIEDPVGYMF